MFDFRLPRPLAAFSGALLATLLAAPGTRAWAAETPAKAPRPASTAGKGPAAPPADSSPLAEMKKSNANLKKMLAKQPATWTPEHDARNSEVRKVVDQFLDFDELAHRALARHWEGISPKQRTDFVATLRDLVERNYLKQMHGSPSYELKFDKETKDGNEASVHAVLDTTTSKGKKVSVDMEYKMVWKNGHWVVFDVITDEQSLLENYRAEFNKIIEKDGFDALLKRMRKKLAEKAE